MLTVPPLTEELEKSCSCLCEKQIPMRTQRLMGRDYQLGRPRQKDYKFKACLGYKAALGNSVRYCLKNNFFF